MCVKNAGQRFCANAVCMGNANAAAVLGCIVMPAETVESGRRTIEVILRFGRIKVHINK